MSRLHRFEDNRFLGTRDDMRVYDCDDSEQLAALEARVESDDLVAKNLVAAISPDTLVEARNRGYRPTRELFPN
jgi:hypothetical protein